MKYKVSLLKNASILQIQSNCWTRGKSNTVGVFFMFCVEILFIFWYFQRREYRRSLRRLRDASNPMELSDGAFRKLFRLNKEGARYLMDKLQPHARTSEIPFMLRFLCALHFFGQGSYQLSVGSCHLLALSQSSVSRAIREVVLLMNNHLVNELIEFPRTVLKIAENKNR